MTKTGFTWGCVYLSFDTLPYFAVSFNVPPQVRGVLLIKVHEANNHRLIGVSGIFVSLSFSRSTFHSSAKPRGRESCDFFVRIDPVGFLVGCCKRR